MSALLNHMRRAAEEAGASRAGTRHGIIDGYDPANHAVKVRLQPDDTLTDWLPLKATWIGNGFGLFLAPNIGDAVEVDFQETDGGAGSVGWRFFNDSERPLSVPSGEAWLVHKSGSTVKLTTDGKITLTDHSGTVFALSNDGKVRITGDLIVSGDVTANGTSLHTHTHSGVQSGSSQTGAPV